jgi:TPR repeat protein
MMFKNGTLVYQNPAEAKRWLLMAAKQGHVSAQLAMKSL